MNLEQFLNTAQDSGLVGRPRLDEVLREIGGVSRIPDPKALAAALVKRGVLTTWQSEKLLSGVQKGFFLGKHKLLQLVATGGMSAVYEAEHVLLHRRVALKVLPRGLVGSSSHLERFYREAWAVARLDHPNIIRGFDVGQDGDHHYFVMEYVEGSSLQDLIEKSGPLPIDRAVELIRQAALGLEHAHRAGLVHRDIKPANLLLDLEGTVKLLDLGLVRAPAYEDDGRAALTRVHDESMLGTVDYLSPEQAIDSHEVDIRSDIYSLGCTLYFLLTGSPPFAKGTLAERLLAHQTRSPAPLASLRPDITESLIQVVARMMAKRPEDRYQAPADVATALGEWLGRRPDSREDREATVGPSGPPSRGPTPRDGGRAPQAIATARKPRKSPSGRPSTSFRPAGSPRPSTPGSDQSTPDGGTTPLPTESWERWARVFETIEARGCPRLRFGEASYRLIHENLLMACRASAESADGPTRERLRQLEDFVAPWLTIQSLVSILQGDMKHGLVGRFREIDRTIRMRPWLARHGRTSLKIAASMVAAALIWSALPLASSVPSVSGIPAGLLDDARQIIRKIADIRYLFG